MYILINVYLHDFRKGQNELLNQNTHFNRNCLVKKFSWHLIF